jgi:hypothetical protein
VEIRRLGIGDGALFRDIAVDGGRSVGMAGGFFAHDVPPSLMDSTWHIAVHERRANEEVA